LKEIDMAKYMMFGPAFLPDGIYYEASLENPKIINLPAECAPSLTWRPLDEEAEAALALLAEEKIKQAVASGTPEYMAKRRFQVKAMPKVVDEAAPVKVVVPQKQITQEEMEQAAAAQMVEKLHPPKIQEVVVVPKGGKRPSDQEPK
jgi:hypothetical protein